jgi:hypothetical protein
MVLSFFDFKKAIVWIFIAKELASRDVMRIGPCTNGWTKEKARGPAHATSWSIVGHFFSNGRLIAPLYPSTHPAPDCCPSLRRLQCNGRAGGGFRRRPAFV